MNEWLQHIIFPTVRWLHLVASTLIVGGTLFFEFVVPKAIEDLREEQQLSVIGHMRWVFRKIVWFAVFLLPVTGTISAYRLWAAYVNPDQTISAAAPWAIAHAIGGMIALILSAALVIGGSVPTQSRKWMQINLILLFAIMFIASAARHMRLFLAEQTTIPIVPPESNSGPLRLPTTAP